MCLLWAGILSGPSFVDPIRSGRIRILPTAKKCHKMNHFSFVCRSGSVRDQKSNRPKLSRGRIKRGIKKSTEDAESTSWEDEFFSNAAEYLARATKIREIGYRMDRTVIVRLNDVDVQIEADSGADVNLMDKHQFKAFVHRTREEPNLQPSRIKLRTLQQKLEVKGEFQTEIRNETCGRPTKFVVVSGRVQSLQLISQGTLIELGMLKIQPDGRFAEPNHLGMSKEERSVSTVIQDEGVQEMKTVNARYKHLFEGFGKIEEQQGNRKPLPHESRSSASYT